MRYRMPLPGESVGPYRIVEQLGVGGSGAVYKAERDGRFYALKFILGRELDDSGEREISILLRLRLPHVVRFVACDRWPDARTGYLFIVMEYVEGRTLQAWAQEENPSALQVVEEFLPLAHGLGAEYTTTGEVPELADPEEDELERELRRWEKHRPRRGKKPEEKAAPAVLQAQAPSEEAEVTPLGASWMEVLKRPALVVGFLAVLLGVAPVVKRSQPVPESVSVAMALPTTSESPDSTAGAAPVLGTPTTPAPTVTAMLHKDDTRLKKLEEKSAPRKKKQGLRSLVEKCVGAACCATLAGCPAAPQVRPTPPAPEACPPGAVETMKRFGIEIGE